MSGARMNSDAAPFPFRRTAHGRAARLRDEAAGLPADRPPRESGPGSGQSTTLPERLSQWLGRPVPARTVGQYPVPAGHLAGDDRAPAVPARGGAGTHEPIAIVGIGCRLPGGIESPQALWQGLLDGVDAVGEVPGDRWNAAGTTTTRRGGFLDDVTGFDADLFRIPPAEARRMDPGQRIALETAWAALEDARIVHDDLVGSRTGVFMGTMAREDDNAAVSARIAHVFGLHGPAPAVATSTGSSLTAAHLAVRSLRDGEVDLALAGGVHVMPGPCTTVAVTTSGGTNPREGCGVLVAAPAGQVPCGTNPPDGRCRASVADPAGHVRGEGCGVLVLRRLSDALAAGDRVYAVIRGSAVHQDGAGAGARDPGAHAEVVRVAWQDAGVGAEYVSYVEVCGSGGSVGDGAGAGVCGLGGSVGDGAGAGARDPGAHAEVVRAAWQDAGVGAEYVSYVEACGSGAPPGDRTGAGALGAVFADGRTEPPRIGSATTHFGHLESAAGVVGLMKTALALHHGEFPAGLHVAAPDPLADVAAGRLRGGTGHTPWPGGGRRYAGVGGTDAHLALEEAPYRRRLFVPLAADSAGDLRVAADALTGRVRAGGAWYAPELLGRATGTHRVVAAVAHPGELADALRDAHVAAHARGPAARPDALALCFSGHGPQWFGMGRDLLGEPAFRAALDACDRALLPFTGWSVTEELLADRATSRLERTDVVQPVLFALQTALARTLSAWGVEPTVVFGQGAGEVAAAVFAGALPLAEGARLIATWSRLATERARGLGATPDGASHSARLEQRLGPLRTRIPAVPFWSAATGGYADGTDLDAAYWTRALRAPTCPAEAVRTLAGGRGLRVVEITPHPVAGHALQRALEALGGDQPRVLSTGRRDRSARQALEDVAAALWCDGSDVDWGAVTGRRRRRAAPAPLALTVSGRTVRARAENAARLAAHLDATPDAGLLDVAYTAALHRPHLEHRASVVAASSAEAAQALRALADGRAHPGLVQGEAAAGTDLAMLFTGRSGHRVGRERELYAAFPEFRRALDEVCAALDPYLRLPLAAVLFAAPDGPDAVLIHEPEFAQPGSFAVEVALFRLWESWGVVPAAVAGRSVGEVAAAHVAGALGLADAARLVAARGRLTQAYERGGAMTAQAYERGGLMAAHAHTYAYERRGAMAAHAFRSPHIAAMPGEFDQFDQFDQFEQVAAECVFAEPSIAWVSTVTGGVVSAAVVSDPAYWVRQLRAATRFAEAVRTCENLGVGRYVECGPAAVPAATAASCVAVSAEPAVSVASRRGADEPMSEVRLLVRALGELYVAGQDVRWERVLDTGVPVDLPGYAFQREHHRPEPARTHPGRHP
ncbi:acyltransferase domain-containing protein [Streptomyces sp. NPDC000410]|uniref:acyltransferase domain-containing protein n=1 Tax=Streptomyces sp. NPDC000410 TaxID=3154254 RepID=UPI003323EE6C